ncbi:uncharacterized protein METZ01_LOCUS373645, partial [marine metagenome]
MTKGGALPKGSEIDIADLGSQEKYE